MPDNAATTELLLVLAVMLVLLVFGLAAVVIFWRVWRKERKGGDSDGSTRLGEPRSGGSQ